MSFSSARVNIFIRDKLAWNGSGWGSEEESSRKKVLFQRFFMCSQYSRFPPFVSLHLSTWHQHWAFSLDGKYTALTSILIKHKSRCNDHIFIILGCFWSWNKVRTRVSSERMSCRRAFKQITFEKWLFYDEMNGWCYEKKKKNVAEKSGEISPLSCIHQLHIFAFHRDSTCCCSVAELMKKEFHFFELNNRSWAAFKSKKSLQSFRRRHAIHIFGFVEIPSAYRRKKHINKHLWKVQSHC